MLGICKMDNLWGGQKWKHHVDHIHECPSMQSEDEENDSDGIVENDGPLSSSSSPRPSVELDTTAHLRVSTAILIITIGLYSW